MGRKLKLDTFGSFFTVMTTELAAELAAEVNGMKLVGTEMKSTTNQPFP